jgi:hypothetical protein
VRRGSGKLRFPRGGRQGNPVGKPWVSKELEATKLVKKIKIKTPFKGVFCSLPFIFIVVLLYKVLKENF